MKSSDLNLINEGVEDPHIFKAVFMIGGPASGKSTVIKPLFGGSGMRPIDIDEFYKIWTQKWGLAGGYEKEVYQRVGRVGDRALNLLVQGRRGLVIDGTGRYYQRVIATAQELESLGYDTMAIFVDTPKDTAEELNRRRRRQVPKEFFDLAHEQVRANINNRVFEEHFGEMVPAEHAERRARGRQVGFWSVNVGLTPFDIERNLRKGIDGPEYRFFRQYVHRWMQQPPANPKARRWMADQRNTKSMMQQSSGQGKDSPTEPLDQT